MRLRPAYKCHGGKFYLAPWILNNFPEDYPQYDYVEPYCGGANLLLRKQRSRGKEILNDLDPGVFCILNTLKDYPNQLVTKLRSFQYHITEFCAIFELVRKGFSDQIEYAAHEFALRRMSRGGLKKAFAWSDRIRGGKPGDVNAWETAIDMLPAISQRLQGVEIRNELAIDVLMQSDSANTLVYADPTYLPETRKAKKAYEFEMTVKQHEELGAFLNQCRSKVVLSGYHSELYSRLYRSWNVVQKEIANHSSQQKTKSRKIEVLWKNF